MSMPRDPSSDQSAISIAPVSEPGTMPSRQSAGICRRARLRSITSASLALPAFERWERPRQAAFSASSDQPGRLAQGPEEKYGRSGRFVGFDGRGIPLLLELLGAIALHIEQPGQIAMLQADSHRSEEHTSEL